MQNLYMAITAILIWVGSLFFAQYVVPSRPWPEGMRNTKQEKPYGSKRVGTDRRSYQNNNGKFEEVAGAAEAPEANPNPDRNEWREEQDVQAQSDMAAYARWSAYISGTGIADTRRPVVHQTHFGNQPEAIDRRS